MPNIQSPPNRKIATERNRIQLQKREVEKEEKKKKKKKKSDQN